MITRASVDVRGMRVAVLDLLTRHRAPAGGWWRRLVARVTGCMRLTSYECVLHWQGGRFIECDVRAVVQGFERPARHCREAYIMGKRDPDQIARARIAEAIIMICEPLWQAYSNVRVRAYLSRGVPSCVIEEPGIGTLV